MAYMLLVIEAPGDRDAPEAERRLRHERMVGFAGELQQRGLLVAADSLAPPVGAPRIRKRGGRQTVIDGPFAEAKEIVGGFFYLNCDTIEEAAAIGQECPAAEWSTIEVRKVADCFEESA
jgi:hypothetical protein